MSMYSILWFCTKTQIISIISLRSHKGRSEQAGQYWVSQLLVTEDTFGGCSAHLAYFVHKSGHKTSNIDQHCPLPSILSIHIHLTTINLLC